VASLLGQQKGRRARPPQVGEFKDGVGELFAVDTINNKTILIRLRWTNMNTTPHFEQSFSDDGGKI
jgi:hypothetical protein